jgi:hypothetical protein
MATIQEIEAQVSRLGTGSKFVKRKEIKALPTTLWDNEEVKMVVEGYFDTKWGLIVATNQRLLLIYKGVFGGAQVEALPYDKISSVRYDTGMVFGKIYVNVGGGTRRSIENVAKVQAKEIGDFIGVRCSKVQTELGTNDQSGRDDVGSLLERLAGLRDRGIISEEEFTAKKRSLLGL